MTDPPDPSENPADSSSAAPGSAGTPVCPQCMAVNEPDADFCRSCGAPLTAIAAMDPYKQIFAQGWIYRRATSRPTSLLVVLGMWLIFGPAVLVVCCAMLPWSLQFSPWRYSPIWAGLSLVIVLAAFGLYAMILYRVTRRYLDQRAIKPGHCRECGYDLEGLPESRCPECGSSFDPEELFDTEEAGEGADGADEAPPR